MIAQAALDALLCQIRSGTHRIWLARRALVDAAGGTWSDELRAIATNALEGAAIVERRPALYLAAFAQDLETMPPEVVLGRVARFLRNDLRAVLAIPDWRDLSWHVDASGDPVVVVARVAKVGLHEFERLVAHVEAGVEPEGVHLGAGGRADAATL